MHIHGSITALATPFVDPDPTAGDPAIDRGAWRRLLERQVAGGTQALVVAGSTGEAAALEPDEYAWLLAEAVALASGRVPVIAGTGMSATGRTVRATREAAALGATAALVVTPPYVRPTQDGLRRHFLEVAERGDLPLLLYNVPPRTGCDLLPETVATLVHHPRIIGIKEARPEPERMQALLALRSDAFAVLGGDDPTACRALLAGADGCISVASNVVPRSFRRLCDAARAGHAEAANGYDSELAPLYARLGAEPNPIPVKALLAALGLCRDSLRLPLLPMSAGARAALEEVVPAVLRLESASPAHSVSNEAV